ncbi:uncharacterized protein LOC143881947 isoform X3 [Tasmannia lanceolata]|uniref:uncharacterized protein LOC143881947 isoform X3 n=1 Tax=Tasmannia lanceolata TaxID=3420 RepID=UPI0040632F8E
MDSPPDNDCCSICHDPFNLPCQANCSHWFCGNCFMRVWHHASILQPCKCPICRRLVTLLIPSEDALSQRSDPEAGQVLENVEKYNRLFGGGSHGLIQMAASIIYVVSPVDIIPEGLFGILGLLDDLIIVLIVFFYLAALYQRALISRHGGTQGA